MMRDPTALPAQLIEEAAYWFIAMRDETVGAENRAAFAEWLHASPQHVRAYLETAALWGEAAHLPPEPALAIVGTDDLGNVVPFRPRTTPVVDTDPLTERMASLRLRLAMVVGLCALLVAGGLFFARGEVLSTGVGEQRLVTLEDGSIVRLNARSKVVVRMSAKRRDLELIEGQALFDVAKDPRRPFVVHTDGMAVSALGTSFDVNRRRNGTVLTVLDGRVRLDARPDKGAAARAASGGIAVAAGEQATVDKSGAVNMGVAAQSAGIRGRSARNRRRRAQPLLAPPDRARRRGPRFLENQRRAAAFQSGRPAALPAARSGGADIVWTVND
jgi:transmembrane sensor